MKKILLYPLTTEKSIRMIEIENKITFVVNRKAGKVEIAKAITENFKSKVKEVNVQIINNKKVAFIRLKPETPAIDIATKLGII
ncbi:MAG: 50S ribosomal protein L23 [Candidatus Pacearchaeota archaeon]|nr:MAG: 50S ribosomal protein L23 [Candidatus Pacearchaeota archaeon]